MDGNYWFLDEARGGNFTEFRTEVTVRAESFTCHPSFAKWLADKQWRRIANEHVKTLVKMPANFFGPDPSYHKVRQAFVYKRPAPDSVCPDRGQRFHGALHAFNKALHSTTLATLMLSVLSLRLTGCQSLEPNEANSLEPVQSATAASAREPITPLKTLEVRAVDLAFQASTLTVAKPGRYLIKLINTGSMPHNMTFPDGKVILAAPGETASAEIEVPADGMSFICSVPGHFPSGMKGEIWVAGSGSKEAHSGPAAAISVEPDPKAPPYSPSEVTAPEALPGNVHDIDLVVQEKMMTVATGFVQNVWTYNGTVPAPVIRVRVGDTIRAHLKNPSTNKLGHSIDFHASQTAWNDQMTTISPGEEKLYEWHADYAGVWMYHCGSNPALHHIANGLYGMVIVEPKEGLPKADHEFALVQSEWYLGPQGQPTDLAKAAAGAPAPDFVVFNGVANQYKDHPLQVDTGKRVRLFVLNTGPNVDSSFHIVGTIFDTVIKEGVLLTPHNRGHYGAQAVDLAPAQGAIIEFTTAEDGLYPIVTHAFNFVGRGALGLVEAGDGDPKGDGLAKKR